MEVPEFVRGCLTRFREDGLPFMEAWSRTLHALPRGNNIAVARQRREWVEILKWSRPAWQASYEGVSIEMVLEPEPRPRLRAVKPVRLELVA